VQPGGLVASVGLVVFGELALPIQHARFRGGLLGLGDAPGALVKARKVGVGQRILGLQVGKAASLVVLDAGNPVEALRLRAERLCVVSRGKVVAERPRRDTALSLPGRPASVNRRHVAPN